MGFKSSGISGHKEDDAHVSGDVGPMVLAVRNDALAALAGTDGDYAPFQVDAAGALYTTGGLASACHVFLSVALPSALKGIKYKNCVNKKGPAC